MWSVYPLFCLCTGLDRITWTGLQHLHGWIQLKCFRIVRCSCYFVHSMSGLIFAVWEKSCINPVCKSPNPAFPCMDTGYFPNAAASMTFLQHDVAAVFHSLLLTWYKLKCITYYSVYNMDLFLLLKVYGIQILLCSQEYIYLFPLNKGRRLCWSVSAFLENPNCKT